MITTRVLYSCALCGVVKVGVDVPARQDEDVRVWMDHMIRFLMVDHVGRSPNCAARKFTDVMIPMSAGDDQMALTITFQNDLTGTDDAANYDVCVYVNRNLVARERVEGHPRSEDWRALVRRLVSDECELANEPVRCRQLEKQLSERKT